MMFTSQVLLQRIFDDVYKLGLVTEECLSPRLGQDTAEKCHQELAAVFTPELALAVYIPLCRIFGRSVRSCTICLSSLAGQSCLVLSVCLLWQVSHVLYCLPVFFGRSVMSCFICLLWQVSEVLYCRSVFLCYSQSVCVCVCVCECVCECECVCVCVCCVCVCLCV